MSSLPGMTAEEMGAAIRAGDDPTVVVRYAMEQARREAIEEARRAVRMTYWKLVPAVAESRPIFDFAEAAGAAIHALLSPAASEKEGAT